MSLLGKELEDLVALWNSFDWETDSKNEVARLSEKGRQPGGEDAKKTLQSMLGSRIAFGTSGLRGRMATGFAHMNHVTVSQASQGLCMYLERVNPLPLTSNGVIVGFDGRHNSRKLAQLVAGVFLSRGHKVKLFSDMVPTPFVSFGVRHFKCAAGICVTASHNPKDDNGYKVYWDNGAQIIPPHDEGIADAIMKHLKIWDYDWMYLKQSLLLQDPMEEVQAAYFRIAKTEFCSGLSFPTPPAVKLAYTAMHGVGCKAVQRVVKEFGLPEFAIVAEQAKPDPDFPTVAFPNPEEGEGALKLAMATADREGAHVVLANDPDADRLAVAERQKDGSWRIFDGNEIALLFASWLWKRHCKLARAAGKERPDPMVVIASTVSSKVLKAMAAAEGFAFEEALTGFKWMGNLAEQLEKARGLKCLLAYEVEIGFMLGSTALDKDGIKAAAVMAEMCHTHYARSGSAPGTLAAELQFLAEKYGHFVMESSYFFHPGPAVMGQVFSALRKAGPDGKLSRESYPTHCGPFAITHVRDLTLGYDSQQPDGKAVLPVSASTQMLTFTFACGALATLRGSGTEPKLKYYVEGSSASSREAAARMCAAVTEALVLQFLRPNKFGLRAPAGKKASWVSKLAIEDPSTVDIFAGDGPASLAPVEAKLRSLGQSHILRFWSELSGEEKLSLLEQVSATDFDGLHAALKARAELAALYSNASRLSPWPSTTELSATPAATQNAWSARGLAEVAAGRVAVILLAGGLATRLTSGSGPAAKAPATPGGVVAKALLPIGPLSNKLLLQIHLEKLLALQRAAAAATASTATIASPTKPGAAKPAGPLPSVPLYMMVSRDNMVAIHKWLQDEKYCGLPRDDVVLFPQGNMPCVDLDGRMLLNSKSSLSTSPDGHGGVFEAMRRAGVLRDMADRGIEHVFLFSVDNPLAKVADPLYVGLCAEQNADMGYKVVSKRSPSEPAGVVCLLDGHPTYVEYMFLPKSCQEMTVAVQATATPPGRRPPEPKLAFNTANILNVYYRRAFLEKVLEKERELVPYHCVPKPIPYFDPDTKQKVEPPAGSKTGYKLEKLAMAPTDAAGTVTVLQVERAHEFAPIKNGWGAKEDSPEVAQRMLSDLCKTRVEAAGAKVVAPGGAALCLGGAADPLCEISPLLTEAELTAMVQGKTLRLPFLLDPVTGLTAK
eukprot:jgi/Mesvir1/6560/Mv16818-RA.1